MKSIEISDLEAECLKLVDDVVHTGDPLAITRNGKPVAVLAPYARKPASLLGLHSSAVEILGDIVSPLDDPRGTDR